MTMISRRMMTVLAAATALALAAVVPARAQGTQDKPTAPPTLPTKVDVVISRYQGEKKISSQPYVLMPTASPGMSQGVSLRMGVDVPAGTTTTTRLPEAGRAGVTTTEPQYQSVGTNIDCRVISEKDGRFSVYVSVTDSSIFNADSPSTMGRPTDTSAIRKFQASNTLTMRDGQTMLLITATDKVTGEIVKVEVTLSVLK